MQVAQWTFALSSWPTVAGLVTKWVTLELVGGAQLSLSRTARADIAESRSDERNRLIATTDAERDLLKRLTAERDEARMNARWGFRRRLRNRSDEQPRQQPHECGISTDAAFCQRGLYDQFRQVRTSKPR